MKEFETMAANNPELQIKLEELEHELEVRQSVSSLGRSVCNGRSYALVLWCLDKWDAGEAGDVVCVGTIAYFFASCRREISPKRGMTDFHWAVRQNDARSPPHLERL